MITAVMFSGVDALDDPALRSAALGLQQVRRRLGEAEQILEATFGARPDLVSFLRADEQTFHANLPLKAFVCAVTQVGLFDLYLESNRPPDYLVGLSLGDAARTTCSGTLDFATMVAGTYLFNLTGQAIEGGAIVRVRADRGPLTREQVWAIEAEGLSLAVEQTPRHFLVSGPRDELDGWARVTAPHEGFHVKPLYDKPLHSAGMRPAAQAVMTAFASAAPSPPQIAMVSAVFTRVIDSPEVLISDIERNMVGCVHWWRTFTWMAEHLGVERFVNIGPATTLIRLAERIPLATRIKVEDLLDRSSGREVPGGGARCVA